MPRTRTVEIKTITSSMTVHEFGRLIFGDQYDPKRLISLNGTKFVFVGTNTIQLSQTTATTESLIEQVDAMRLRAQKKKLITGDTANVVSQ